MESSEDVEVLNRAIENLFDEKTKREAAGDSFIDDDQLLLSQLETPNPFQKTSETTKEEELSPDSSPSKGLSHPGMLSGLFKSKLRPIKNKLHGTKEENNLHNGNGTTNNGVHIQVHDDDK